MQEDGGTIFLGISFLTVAGMIDDGVINALTSIHKQSECLFKCGFKETVNKYFASVVA